MSALPQLPQRWIAPMGVSDLDEVLRIEAGACLLPWTRGNFIDSLAAGHAAVTLRGADGGLLGYLLAMTGVEELHLLNLTIDPVHQRRGHGRFLLQELVRMGERAAASQLLLEVRRSNLGAKALYADFGFAPIGVRRGYYPARPGISAAEDADVMVLPLPVLRHDGEPGR